METNELFQHLAERYGNHSKAAQALGVTPEHYRRVRREGRISGPLKVLVEYLAHDSDRQGQPSDG
jgi:hypothetical protein